MLLTKNAQYATIYKVKDNHMYLSNQTKLLQLQILCHYRQ